MTKLPLSKTVLIVFVAITTCLLDLSSALAAQLNGVNVSFVRVYDKDNSEFAGFYGLICVETNGPTTDFGNCGSGKVYCVTEGEAYGRGMVAIALTAATSGKKVNIRSTMTQCEMIEVLK